MRALALLLVSAALAGCIGPSAPTYDEPATATPSPAAATPDQPYAGEESREIKALSPEEIAGYQTGAGLGYAKPAELNSYPGPLHALEMADRLELTEDQRAQMQQIRADMLEVVVPLGERFLDVEASLERGFRDGTMDETTLRELLDESADIEAQIRYAHLQAHLATKAIMTRHQVAVYDEMRGYGDADHGAHGHEM